MTASWDDDGYYDAAFGVGKSRRYHAFMRAFYQRLSDWTLAAQALTGAAAFVALLPAQPNSLLPKILTAVVAVAATLDLVFRFSQKARVHDELCGKFTQLAADMAEMTPNAKNLQSARASRIRLEASEPTERRLIDLRAHNDELSARGVSAERFVPLDFWQMSWLAYLFTFGESNIRKRMKNIEN
jgi:hypothetical protein